MSRKEANKEILRILKEYIDENCEHLRFGQILFNLNINEFTNKVNPENGNFLLRDIYNDESSRILERMLKEKK